MSSVMRPSGPLPPRVYWTRRLLALLVLVVVISILWWCVQKVTGKADESSDATSAPSSDSTPTADASSDGEGTSTPSSPDDETASGGVDQPRSTDKPRKAKRKKQPLIAPTGGCDVADVAMTIEVSDVDEGKPNKINLELTGPAGTACTQAITPNTLVMRITSGDDVVWSSDACPDKVLAEEVVVRADPAGVYTFTWDGRRSTGSCTDSGSFAKPGGYSVEAALIGADAQAASFNIRAT